MELAFDEGDVIMLARSSISSNFMELEKVAQEKWKAVRDFGTTTSQISVVLFAALIASWLGMWEHLKEYRNPVASLRWTDKHNRVADQDLEKRLGSAVRGRLLQVADRIAPEPEDLDNSAESPDKQNTQSVEQLRKRADELKSIAKEAATNPLQTLEKLTKSKDWRAPILAEAIRAEVVYLNQNRESAGQLLKHFELKKAPVEKVPFKLLGVEFAVNGLWGWIVWLAFFVGGFLNLFLVRRALIRRCRSCWALLSDQESANFSANRDSLPIWMRPLPSEKWVPVMTNGAYADAAMDPLSVLCLILMVACTGVALSVLWIGVLSTPLLRAGTGWQPWILLHAAAICLIFGLLLGLVSAWKNSPDTPAKQSTELLGRRTVVVALISTSAGAIVYFNPVYEILKRILLHEGRHRRLLSVFGKRQRRHKHNVEKMPTGFLKDGEGKIHYVPASGIARSLRANSAGAILFKGPFDREILPYVHHSALVPFARQAVVDLLRGVRHRPKLEERKQLLKTAEIQQRYATAFDLVLAAIERERGMRFRRGAMPNLQLYDLLGDIAINANSGQLIARATDVLKSAQVLSPAPVKKTPRTRSSEPSKTKHNYHCKPSRKTPLSDRRKLHLNAFKGQRIEQVALSIDSSGIGETDIRKGPENPSNPVIFSRGTWDPARVNDETANMQPVVRIRKRVRKNRIHGRVRVKSC